MLYAVRAAFLPNKVAIEDQQRAIAAVTAAANAQLAGSGGGQIGSAQGMDSARSTASHPGVMAASGDGSMDSARSTTSTAGVLAPTQPAAPTAGGGGGGGGSDSQLSTPTKPAGDASLAVSPTTPNPAASS